MCGESPERPLQWAWVRVSEGSQEGQGLGLGVFIVVGFFFVFFFASEARLPCPPLEPLLCRQPGSEAGFGFSEFSGSTPWGPHQVLAHLSGPGAQALEEISVFLTFFKKTFIGV